MNSRPLTYQHEDDVSEPLTPYHLLTGYSKDCRSKLSAPSSTTVERNHTQITKRLAHLHNTMELYWQRFRHVYLSQLREHHMHVNKRRTNDRNILNVGDVVVVKNEKIVPRNSWRLGRVESIVVGKDNCVRGAKLSTMSNEGRRTTIRRPLQKIIPFELVSDSSQRPSTPSVDRNPEPIEEVINASSEQHDELSILPSVDSTTDSVVVPNVRRSCAILGEMNRRATNQK